MVIEGVMMNMNLRLARVSLNLSQEKLASLVGVSRQTIILIEKDEFNPSIKLCIKLSRVLNRSLDDLFLNHDIKDGR
jgi:putative transcriptional regulator